MYTKVLCDARYYMKISMIRDKWLILEAERQGIVTYQAVGQKQQRPDLATWPFQFLMAIYPLLTILSNCCACLRAGRRKVAGAAPG